MKQFKPNVVIILLLTVLIVPSFVYASWWNPFTWNWNIFNLFLKSQTNTVQQIKNTNQNQAKNETTPVVASSANNNPNNAYIKVISPNGGEQWTYGNKYTIKWESSGVDKVYINLIGHGFNNICLLNLGNPVSAKDGQFSFSLDKCLSYENSPPRISSQNIIDAYGVIDYTIEIFSLKQEKDSRYNYGDKVAVRGYSNNYFHLLYNSNNLTTQNNYVPSQLKQLADLHLITRAGDPVSQVQYFEVQNININGSKLILAADNYCDGEGCIAPNYYRFLQNGNNFTYLTKYSAQVAGEGPTENYLNASSSDIDIPVLDFPAQLQDPKTKAVVELDSNSLVAGDWFNPQKDLFNPKGKILVFSTDGYDVFLPNSISTDEAYYVQAPDGKELTYNLVDTFLKKSDQDSSLSLDIQWSGGRIHSNKYSFENFDRCGEGEYYIDAVMNNPILQSDLITVGTDKDNGQPIYAINDPNNTVLLAIQAQKQAVGAKYSPYDVIYWKDPFGRLIRFVFDMDEGCLGGKPVIYLYPTTSTNVSVQVNPVGGISKPEPIYNNGWNVLAQPSGVLTYNNTQYPYLFWEGGLGSYKIPNNGFVVPKQQVQKLLSEKSRRQEGKLKLATVTLRRKERIQL